jgi:hypothetical protein
VRNRRSSLGAGFAALSSGRLLIFLLTGVTVVLAFLAAAPLGPSLRDSFGGTLAGDHVLKNHPSFAPTDVFDFLREKAPAIAGAGAAARWAALIGLLQQILFAGGIVAVLGRPVPVSLPDFVAGVRRNAWHNITCFLIFLLGAGAVLGAWFAATHAVWKKSFEGLPPGSASSTIFRAAVVLVALFFYAVFSLLHDFARAARRDDFSIGAWRAYGRAGRTLSGRWARALGIFFFWLLFGGAVLLLGIALEWTAPAVTALAIALHVLIQIAVLTILPAIRIAAWGSYLALYDQIQPTLAPAPVVVLPPPEPVVLALPTLDEKPLV